VVRAVLPGDLTDARWQDLFDGIEEGWRAFLEQLRFLFDRRPEGRRRTVYLSATASPGQVLAATAPTESGGPWHASRYQRITVDTSGALVAVLAQTPLESGETAPASVTVTTYGLDDAAFAAVRDSWSARWRGIAADATVTP
jgi:hypothetical protein